MDFSSGKIGVNSGCSRKNSKSLSTVGAAGPFNMVPERSSSNTRLFSSDTTYKQNKFEKCCIYYKKLTTLPLLSTEMSTQKCIWFNFNYDATHSTANTDGLGDAKRPILICKLYQKNLWIDVWNFNSKNNLPKLHATWKTSSSTAYLESLVIKTNCNYLSWETQLIMMPSRRNILHIKSWAHSEFAGLLMLLMNFTGLHMQSNKQDKKDYSTSLAASTCFCMQDVEQ